MLSVLSDSHDSGRERVAYHVLRQHEYAELEPHAEFMESASTDEMRRRGAANGMFRMPAQQRAQVQQALDVRHHAVDMTSPLAQSDEILDAAYKIGVLTEKTNRSVWQNNRFWRFLCSLMAACLFALVSLLVYWIVNIGNSVSDTLDKIQYRNPTIIQDTVDDARTLLHGAAVASQNMGQIAQHSQPALVNLTQSSSVLLGSLASLMTKPRITIDMGAGQG